MRVFERQAMKPFAKPMLGLRAGLPLLLALGGAAIAPAPAAAAPPVGDGSGGFGLTPIGSFDEPVEIVDAPGKKNRELLFVAEQDGRIVVLRNGVPQPRPFLDLSSRVMNAGEQGLLSLAFHPRYERNRRLYIYFTNLAGDNEVVELKRSKRSRLVANPATARLVLYLSHPTFGNHNGGQLQFGPRGLLFIGPGDGGAGRDPPNNAQNPDSLLGKLLRIDPVPRARKKKGKRKSRKGKAKSRAAKARRSYRIPRDNPFVGKPGRDEVYSLGLRNPYRFTFDSLTGAIAIGDVGQGCREEIDYRGPGGARGANFGWSRFEGSFLHDPSRQAPGAIGPILEYDNAGAGPSCSPLGGYSGTSVIPGYVVRDPRLTHQYGRLLYTDFANDEIRTLIPSEGGAIDDRSTGISLPGFGAPDSFGETRGGVLWVVSHEGPIYRLDP
jgi:glucose/arabinose dehydrogenase